MDTWNKSYSQVVKLKTFKERYEYLKLGKMHNWLGRRWLNQKLYQKFPEWQEIRRKVIIRDEGFDLAHKDIPIIGKVIVHHINPITEQDIINRNSKIFDLENLICCSLETHDAIHYANPNVLPSTEFIERRPNDTCPWKI